MNWKILFRCFSFYDPEAVIRMFSVKKLFLNILQNSPENTCVRVSFSIKLQTSACDFIEKENLAQIHFYMTRPFSRNIHFSFDFHIVVMENMMKSFCLNSDT